MDSTSTTTTPAAAWQGLAPDAVPQQGSSTAAPVPEVGAPVWTAEPAVLTAERPPGAAPGRRGPALWGAAALVAVAAAGAWVVLPLEGSTTSTASTAVEDPRSAAPAEAAPSDAGAPAAEGGGDAGDSGDAWAPPPSGTIAPVVSLTPGATVTAPSTSPPGVDAGGAPTSYAPANLLDADPSTCWRTDGDGRGLVLDVVLDRPRTVTRVGLVNGYAKVDPASGEDRYAQERRITRVTWTVGDQVVVQDLTDGTRSAQTVAVEPTSTDRVSVRVEATTAPGDAAFDKTAISDITLLGT